jgi:hypothetical protein
LVQIEKNVYAEHSRVWLKVVRVLLHGLACGTPQKRTGREMHTRCNVAIVDIRGSRLLRQESTAPSVSAIRGCTEWTDGCEPHTDEELSDPDISKDELIWAGEPCYSSSRRM